MSNPKAKRISQIMLLLTTIPAIVFVTACEPAANTNSPASTTTPATSSSPAGETAPAGNSCCESFTCGVAFAQCEARSKTK